MRRYCRPTTWTARAEWRAWDPWAAGDSVRQPGHFAGQMAVSLQVKPIVPNQGSNFLTWFLPKKHENLYLCKTYT